MVGLSTRLIKNNMQRSTFSREVRASFFEKSLETGIFSVMIKL
jgi:hypothetical protein